MLKSQPKYLILEKIPVVQCAHKYSGVIPIPLMETKPNELKKGIYKEDGKHNKGGRNIKKPSVVISFALAPESFGDGHGIWDTGVYALKRTGGSGGMSPTRRYGRLRRNFFQIGFLHTRKRLFGRHRSGNNLL